MSNAQNHPVQRPKQERHTSDTAINELAPVSLALDEDLVRERIVTPADGAMDLDQIRNLAFAEEPITILINKSSEKNAPNSVHCASNGKGAEVQINGRWLEMQYLPVNVAVTTKRKYVEILARAKQTSYTTKHDEPGAEYIHNQAIPNTSRAVNFSVIGDSSARGAEWLQRLFAERE